MPQITFPDDSVREYADAVSVAQVARDIGAGLARDAVAGKVDGRVVDTAFVVENDARLAVLTAADAEGLEVVRHSTAHLMAQAVKQLYPDTQVTIGPVIRDGFYYDFARRQSFSEGDLEKIEQRMGELAAADIPLERSVMGRDEAVKFFRGLGENYKAEIIAAIPEGEELSLYRQGDFTDLCRGPHVPSTGKLKAFKLMKVAGAYWRGDSSREMLQRIYGTAWPDRKSLRAHLHQLAEAVKRDHRKLGRELDLFHFQEEAPGMVFWHRKGWELYRLLENYMRELLREYDYQEVHTPQLMDRALWQRSGHWEKFHQHMFYTSIEEREYALKPMNCPGHVQVFNQGLRSYRELPVRLGEFGLVHRYEDSGALHGLLRVRRFTQDDAHVFCTPEQIHDEVSALLDIAWRVYGDTGFDNVAVALSTRPEQRVGEEALWDRAEQILQDALQKRGLEYQLQPGEGAFYGPKIDLTLQDSIGRSWQCGTIQLDFMMPGRLGAAYVAEDSSRRTPVMIHRTILGSMERFIGILLEDCAGRLPPWLAPVQAVLLNITERQEGYLKRLAAALRGHGFRAECDLRNEKIGLKIRHHTLQRVPYLLVAGDREVDDGTVSVRTREGKDLGAMKVAAFTRMLGRQVARRSHKLEPE
ncbi:MAG: threonine--tRNA ligase [Gammaproteobacteria bacterium]|nr:threonine--tRNA ligase [Gammaproteobacteria bacterium]MDD9799995.1 threonine--tRNA ligase [Gammaproteobacteria bacterium]MDD9815086.1 threonine--tRNA ligase [Gammaproteobacteria bacterium]MDD9852318.1 threonine--tRNA ligase [Gammaproteobacteria bacterium]MDD9870000.1 threonine--tRNA ligase [Gammaproteobacteria bacterium]